jgi:ABC-type transport system involved in multi-copper enzyme maturation permease subunit
MYDNIFIFEWGVRAIPSNISYTNLQIINFVEAIIAVFLASDFMKRDYRLDTSEVFYVHPLSNAQYVIGKVWGNLKMFLVLNLVLLMIVAVIAFASNKVEFDALSFVEYLILINIPTLIFIIGLSIFMMSVFKNQAITFIVLLAYIGFSLFYLKDKCYFLFDYMSYFLPVMKSQVLGFVGLETILIQRGIYLLAGLGFIFISISRFPRLPNSPKGHYKWITVSIISLTVSGGLGIKYIYNIIENGNARKLYVETNNRYVDAPKIVVEEYNISVVQGERKIFANAAMKGKALKTSQEFIFHINPGLHIDSVLNGDGELLEFNRDRQIININAGKIVGEGENVSLKIVYSGRVDENFSYLDTSEDVLNTYKNIGGVAVNCGKKYCFQEPKYVLFTPETCWYPKPGVSFSNKNAGWNQNYFSWFDLTVKPLKGLTPISQGETIIAEDSVSWRFLPETPLQNITLVIGQYNYKSVKSGNMEFGVWHFDKHDYFADKFDSIMDKVPGIVLDVLEGAERKYKLDYPFNRFNIVETPAQFTAYERSYTQAQDVMQPELSLFPEKGWSLRQFDIERMKKGNEYRYTDQQITEIERQENQLRRMLRTFIDEAIPVWGSDVPPTANPYSIHSQLLNFRFNIYSEKWTVANRIFEQYLKENNANNNPISNETRGINFVEKANMLLDKYSYHDILADEKNSYIINYVTKQITNQLFSEAEINIGTEAFRDTVLNMIKRNEFTNIELEQLLANLSSISNTDINENTEKWNAPIKLPYYNIQKPTITVVNDKGTETTVLNLVIDNLSNNQGVIHINVPVDNNPSTNNRDLNRRRAMTVTNLQDQGTINPITNRKIIFQAREKKHITILLDNIPSQININTLLSLNLPFEYKFTAENVRRENRALHETNSDVTVINDQPKEIVESIVDNEDENLFSFTQKATEGLLPKLLHKTKDTEFKYKDNPSWRLLNKWTPTIHDKFYGTYKNTAMVIESGKDEQTATWKVPVPEPGEYDIYYHFPYYRVTGEKKYVGGGGYRIRVRNNGPKSELKLTINHDGSNETAYLLLNETGWIRLLDTYSFDCDTITITVDNGKLKSAENFIIIADAVKIQKRK